MKTFFVASLFVSFVVTIGYAGPSHFEIGGSYYVRGSYIENDSGIEEDAGNWMYYDQEFDAKFKISPAEETFIIIKLEARDQNWTASNTDDTTQDGISDLDDNIEIKRLYGSHTFSFGTTVEAGLMTGAAFGTTFFDNSDGYWTLRFIHQFGSGIPVIFAINKTNESGSLYSDTSYSDAGVDLPADAEADDSDLYWLATNLKFDGISIFPYLGYLTYGHHEPDEETDREISVLAIAAEGSFGLLDFESEFAYQKTNYDWEDRPEAADSELYGAYFKGWANLDRYKVGGLFAYGSWDEDGGGRGNGIGFFFGEDFTPTIYGADWAGVGSNRSEYRAVMMFQGFGEYAFNETLSINTSYTYWSSNQKDTIWEDATGYEIDAGMNLKVSDIVTYRIAIGTGRWDLEDMDVDPFTIAYHKLEIVF